MESDQSVSKSDESFNYHASPESSMCPLRSAALVWRLESVNAPLQVQEMPGEYDSFLQICY